MILQILPGDVPAEISNVDTSGLVLGTGNETTTTTSAMASTASTATTTTTLLLGVVSAAGGTLAILADEDLAAHELGIVEGEDGTLGTLGGGELHYSASLGPAVGGGQDVGPGDLAAGGLHVVLEVGPGDVPAEVANVDAAGGVRTRVGLVDGTVVVTVEASAGGAAGRRLGLGVGRDGVGGVGTGLDFSRRGFRLLLRNNKPEWKHNAHSTVVQAEEDQKRSMERGQDGNWRKQEQTEKRKEQ